MPIETDYYDYLGVSTDATESQIKKAFYKKAPKCHPDKFATASEEVKKEKGEEFKKLSHIYNVLSDKKTRERYDRFGESAVKDGVSDEVPEDIFSELFGGLGGLFGRRRKQKFEVKPVIHKCSVNLQEAYKGKSFKAKFTRQNLKDKSCTLDDLKCSSCDGQGSKSVARQVGPGMFQQTQISCSDCYGSGSDSSKVETETVIKTIDLEPGVFDDQKVIVDRMGNEDPETGERTPLVLIIDEQHIQPIKQSDGSTLVFTRGTGGHPGNLEFNIELDVHKAICGGTFSFTHLNDEVKIINIPQNCFNNTTLVCKGLGMPIYGEDGEFGNLFIHTKIKSVDRSVKKRNLIHEVFTGGKMPSKDKSAIDAITLDNYTKRDDEERHSHRGMPRGFPEGFPGGFPGGMPRGSQDGQPECRQM